MSSKGKATSFAGGFHFRIVKAVENRIDAFIREAYPPGSVIRSIITPEGWTASLAWDGNYLWSSDRLRDRIYQLPT